MKSFSATAAPSSLRFMSDAARVSSARARRSASRLVKSAASASASSVTPICARRRFATRSQSERAFAAGRDATLSSASRTRTSSCVVFTRPVARRSNASRASSSSRARMTSSAALGSAGDVSVARTSARRRASQRSRRRPFARLQAASRCRPIAWMSALAERGSSRSSSRRATLAVDDAREELAFGAAASRERCEPRLHRVEATRTRVERERIDRAVGRPRASCPRGGSPPSRRDEDRPPTASRALVLRSVDRSPRGRAGSRPPRERSRPGHRVVRSAQPAAWPWSRGPQLASRRMSAARFISRPLRRPDGRRSGSRL